MGNVHLDKIIEYNKFEDINNTRGKDYSGPYVYPTVKDFQKETVEHFQNKSLIENNIENTFSLRAQSCVTMRKEGLLVHAKGF